MLPYNTVTAWRTGPQPNMKTTEPVTPAERVIVSRTLKRAARIGFMARRLGLSPAVPHPKHAATHTLTPIQIAYGAGYYFGVV